MSVFVFDQYIRDIFQRDLFRKFPGSGLLLRSRSVNYLKVNDQKTEFLPIVPVSAKKLIKELSISVGGALIQAVDKVKNLGVYLDNDMNMSANTSEIVRCCYYHIHHIGKINKFLPRQTRERVVNALVTSRLLCYMAQLTRTLPDYSVFKILPLD